jgi:hypothetical protein
VSRIREDDVRALPVRGSVTQIEVARGTPIFAYFRMVPLYSYNGVRYTDTVTNSRTTHSKTLLASNIFLLHNSVLFFFLTSSITEQAPPPQHFAGAETFSCGRNACLL